VNLSQIADEAKLFYHERRDALRQAEEAVSRGRSKMTSEEIRKRQSRLPAARKIAETLMTLADHKDTLPPALLAEIERDEA
jgi:hypothetical protein